MGFAVAVRGVHRVEIVDGRSKDQGGRKDLSPATRGCQAAALRLTKSTEVEDPVFVTLKRLTVASNDLALSEMQ